MTMPRLGLLLNTQVPGGRDLNRVYREQLASGEAAEAAGFELLLVPEHHGLEDGMCPAPFVLLGALAARTSRIRLGTGVMLPALHNPLHLAEQVAVLDHLSDGRVVAGVGLGRYTARRTLAGFDVERESQAQRFERHVDEMRRALAEGLVTPSPRQDPVPVWVGAQRPVGLRRAAAIGDAWLSDMYRSRAVIQAMASAYRAAAGGGGCVAVVRDACLGGEAELEEWWEHLRAGTWAFRVYLEDHQRSPWADLDPEPARVAGPADLERARWGRDRVVAGDAASVREQLGAYGADWVVLRLQHRTGPPLEFALEQVRRFGELIASVAPARQAELPPPPPPPQPKPRGNE